MKVRIEQVKTFSLELTEVLNKLLKQLDSSTTPLTKDDVKSMIDSPANRLFVAQKIDDKEIVGMLTLIIYRIPVWKKGWIEDLVVDKPYRNKGIATKLIRQAVEIAKSEGVLSLNFTSSPTRMEANRLYERLGFKKRNTNVYRILL